MPLSWRDRVILARIEAEYGTLATATGTHAVLATEVTLTPMEGSDVDRDLDQPFMGPSGTIASGLHQKLAFKVELTGSGTPGTAPAWGPLLRACGCAEVVTAGTDVTYNPVSTGHESVSLFMYVGGTLHRIPGARGTARLELTAQSIPTIGFEFTGLFLEPVDQASVAPSYASWQTPEVASDRNTPAFQIDGEDRVLRTLTLDLACAIEPRFLVGSEQIRITDREDVLSATIEAVPLADWNPYAAAAASATVPVRLTHGGNEGRRVTLDVPRAQVQRPQGIEHPQNVVEWPLRFSPIPLAGNDHWTLEVH
jgi:hypothetical protein